MSHNPALHPALDVLAPLIGTYRGEGAGDFPTIDPFAFGEEVSFLPRGGPVLAYSQRTWDPGTDRPMHGETGFLRPAGEGRIELLLAHTFGLTELQEGHIDRTEVPGSGLRLRLESTVIGVAGTAKTVDHVRRELTLTGDLLRSELWMTYDGVEGAQHLRSELHRVAS